MVPICASPLFISIIELEPKHRHCHRFPHPLIPHPPPQLPRPPPSLPFLYCPLRRHNANLLFQSPHLTRTSSKLFVLRSYHWLHPTLTNKVLLLLRWSSSSTRMIRRLGETLTILGARGWVVNAIMSCSNSVQTTVIFFFFQFFFIFKNWGGWWWW